MLDGVIAGTGIMRPGHTNNTDYTNYSNHTNDTNNANDANDADDSNHTNTHRGSTQVWRRGYHTRP